ncbi:hypothetical protein [Rhodococcus sp. 14-2470-1a]|uniref:hypothetical protein n=1 Tax=Rhodococcus sp. 14-2470-1a TaxID=2023150 RepID=UPI000B9A71BF|nr:hypothetical protein [Rhodococcus sp. 14-2470-1a]OZF44275.1 hypothetical protein CH292_24575 [Rhodococcus sp. 14-2470-1a]
MPRPDLRTVRGVELIRVGRWEISTGVWVVTPADLHAAVAARAAGVGRTPVVKVGHTDPRYDGEPALGTIANLRIVDNGQTLVGDLVNVPAAIAAAMRTAWPQRSVEAFTNYEAADGSRHALVLDGVALLGATAAGIPTLRGLDDVVQLYSGGRHAAARGQLVRASIGRAAPTPAQRTAVRVAASRRRARRAQSVLDTLEGK